MIIDLYLCLLYDQICNCFIFYNLLFTFLIFIGMQTIISMVQAKENQSPADASMPSLIRISEDMETA